MYFQNLGNFWFVKSSRLSLVNFFTIPYFVGILFENFCFIGLVAFCSAWKGNFFSTISKVLIRWDYDFRIDLFFSRLDQFLSSSLEQKQLSSFSHSFRTSLLQVHLV